MQSGSAVKQWLFVIIVINRIVAQVMQMVMMVCGVLLLLVDLKCS